MNCPYCNQKNHIEIDMHADGYSDNLFECCDCGALLHLNNEVLETINAPQLTQAQDA